MSGHHYINQPRTKSSRWSRHFLLWRARSDSAACGRELTVPEAVRPIDTVVGQTALGAHLSDSTLNSSGACAETSGVRQSNPTRPARFFCSILNRRIASKPSPSFTTSPTPYLFPGSGRMLSVCLRSPYIIIPSCVALFGLAGGC